MIVLSSISLVVALCKDGENREVTQINKFEYVQLVARWKTSFSVAVSLDPFLQVHGVGEDESSEVCYVEVFAVQSPQHLHSIVFCFTPIPQEALVRTCVCICTCAIMTTSIIVEIF